MNPVPLPRRHALLAMLGLASMPAASAWADEAVVLVEGQAFERSVRLGGVVLRLNGTGVRAVAWFKGYAAGLYLADLVATTLSRIGAAALPLGLMAVGAGLQLGALREGPRLAGALMTIRHLLLPAWALLLMTWLPLPPAQQAVVVAFAALPTASSAYVLAVRMGGHAGYTAGLVTVSTLIGMVALPLWLAAWRGLQP